jgi:hypothetical protein
VIKEAEMASLNQAADVSDEVKELAAQLHAEIADGRADFGELARLADDISESADALAATFFAIDQALTRRPTGDGRRRGPRAAKGSEQRSKTAHGAGEPDSRSSNQELEQPLEELSMEDLLERARALEIAGRAAMSKEELVEAVRSQEQVSKQELLERAREADIPGRSSMSKEELAEAVRSEESLSKEELLERAREADIPGRSGMSKEELREALRSQ